MSEPHTIPGGTAVGASAVVPGRADGERLLHGVEQDLELLDQLSTVEQVPVFDRLHTGLADALAGTADTGSGPQQMPSGQPQAAGRGRPGA